MIRKLLNWLGWYEWWEVWGLMDVRYEGDRKYPDMAVSRHSYPCLEPIEGGRFWQRKVWLRVKP